MNLRPIKILNNLYFKFEDIFNILEVEGTVSIKAGKNKTIDVIAGKGEKRNQEAKRKTSDAIEIPEIETVLGNEEVHGLAPLDKINKTQINSIEISWARAAKDGKREIFMNTLRPIMKKKLAFGFTEVILEEKAKLLCYKWYESNDKGEEYLGPYLIEDL